MVLAWQGKRRKVRATVDGFLCGAGSFDPSLRPSRVARQRANKEHLIEQGCGSNTPVRGTQYEPSTTKQEAPETERHSQEANRHDRDDGNYDRAKN